MKSLLFILALATSMAFTSSDASVSFTLRNNTLEDIPLRIPGVMNPNLSPMSNSGVSLQIGQEIFFIAKRKKYLLLTVTPDLEGQTLIVNKVIKERRIELGI